MINALICGALGKMGRVVEQIMLAEDGISPVCGVDITDRDYGMPVYPSFDKVKETVDVIVDFSSPAALQSIMDYAVKNEVPVVLASTGYSKEQLEFVDECAKKTAVFKTANFSLGVNLLCKLVKQAAETLGESFDIEIIEKHHNKKTDAPSGTALMLADSCNSAFGGKKDYMNGRSGAAGKRGNEIGIHAVRGGTIVGEHEVMFCGEDEIITLSHSARSKRVFAAGAVKAAKWLYGKPAGKYDMDDLLEGIL